MGKVMQAVFSSIFFFNLIEKIAPDNLATFAAHSWNIPSWKFCLKKYQSSAEYLAEIGHFVVHNFQKGVGCTEFMTEA